VDSAAYATGVNSTAVAGDITGGADQLYGGADNDTLYGDFVSNVTTTGNLTNGNDTLDGGAGDDQMWGDTPTAAVNVGGTVTPGDDNFVFNFGQDGTADIIWDYNAFDGTHGDTITLNSYSGYDTGSFDALTAGNPTGESGTFVHAGDEMVWVVGVQASDLNIILV
jgi:RTX calcium-binding nonapeptide repeat (4 copies)